MLYWLLLYLWGWSFSVPPIACNTRRGQCLSTLKSALFCYIINKMFLSPVAMPCGLHRLPSHSTATLHLPSRGRWTPPCCWWERKLKHKLPFLRAIRAMKHKWLINCVCYFSPGRLQRGQLQHSHAGAERRRGFWGKRRRQMGSERTERRHQRCVCVSSQR